MSIFNGAPVPTPQAAQQAPQQQAPQQQQQMPQQQQAPQQGGHTQQSAAPNLNGMSAQGGGQPPAQWQDPVQGILATATGGQQGQQMPQSVQGQQVQGNGANELDAFTSWFTMQGNGAGQQTPEALDAPLFTMDAAKLQEAMGKASFAGGIDQQLMQRALTGDQTAFGDVLNSVARNVMQQSVLMMQNMIQGGIGTYNNRLSQHLPNQFKQFAAKEQIGGKANMQHGAVQPLVSALVQQAMQANPNLTVAQATQQVEKYLTVFANQFATQQTAQQQPVDALTGQPTTAAPQDTNWAALLGR